MQIAEVIFKLCFQSAQRQCEVFGGGGAAARGGVNRRLSTDWNTRVAG